MRRTSFYLLAFLWVSLGILPTTGCGDAATEKPKNETSENKATQKPPKTESPQPSQPIKSKLPFGDLEMEKAKTGVEPGYKVADLGGMDSSGKSFSIGDYQGKVILLDTWASW